MGAQAPRPVGVSRSEVERFEIVRDGDDGHVELGRDGHNAGEAGVVDHREDRPGQAFEQSPVFPHKAPRRERSR